MKKVKKQSLKSKITLNIFVSILTLGILSSIVVFLYIRNDYLKRRQESLESLNSEIDANLGTKFEYIRLISETLAKLPGVINYVQEEKNYLDINATSAALPKEFNENTQINELVSSFNIANRFSLLYILDKQGNAIAYNDPIIQGNNFSFRPYFQKGIKGIPYLDISFGSVTKKIGYYFSQPIFNTTQEVIGVFVTKIESDIINSSLFDTLSKDKNYFLIDKYGIIYDTNQQEFLNKSLGNLSPEIKNELQATKRYSSSEIEAIGLDQIQEELNSISQEKIYSIKDTIYSIRRISNSPFYVMVSEESKYYYQQPIVISLGISLAVLFISIITSYISSRLIAYYLRPIEEIKKYAFSIANAEKGHLIPIDQTLISDRQDEIAGLYQMLNYLKNKIDESKVIAKEEIKTKTQEINTRSLTLEKQQKTILTILEEVKLEKQRSEAFASDMKKFKMAVDDASDHIVITDDNGIVLYANQAVKRITGFPLDQVIGKKAGSKDLWGGLMEKIIYDKFWHTIKIKKETYTGELRNKRKNGEIYDAAVSVSPILDQDGKVIFFVGIERDISEAKAVDRAKTEFVSLASHQLRTPLSSINWYTELLIDEYHGKLNEKQKEFIKQVYEHCQRMVELVDSLLNVSRLELGTFMIEPEPLNITAMLNQIIKELTLEIKSKNLKVSTNIEKFEKLNYDPKLYRIMVENVLTNAIKYSKDAGDIKITLKKAKKDSLVGGKKLEKDCIIYSVKDSGYGIPEEAKDKIFTKLYRADNVRKMITRGTGLGLYIIKQISTTIGGDTWFESQENKGSTFYVMLPTERMQKKQGSKSLE